MKRYAKETRVSPDKSRAEIERTLERYGADKFMYGWQGNSAVIMFEMRQRRVRFILPLPSKEQFSKEAREHVTGPKPNPQCAYEQATRQAWRSLALIVLAKLEAVASGIRTFEQEFMADTLLPNGTTVGEWIAPQIERVYESGQMPPLLPMPKG